MRPAAIRAALVVGLLSAATTAYAQDQLRPAHLLTTTAEDLGAAPLLAPLRVEHRAATAAREVVDTARGDVTAALTRTSAVAEGAWAAGRDHVAAATSFGDRVAPLDPAFATRAGTLFRPCGAAPWAAGFGARTRADGTTTHRHPGISWTVAADTPAAAVARGLVVFSGPIDGLGMVVVLAHGSGEHTVYGQLRRVGADEGEIVERGQWLGDAGARTPDGRRECYFEIRLDGVPVDPAPWFEPR